MPQFLLPFLFALAACAPPRAPALGDADLGARLEAAIDAEQRDELAAAGYVDVVRRAAASSRPEALPAAAAALDALVWRRVAGGPEAAAQALVARSERRLRQVVAALRDIHAKSDGAPLVRAWIASALHDVALRVGSSRAAHRWRREAGCPRRMLVLGPHGWAPLTSLEESRPPADLVPEEIELDACRIDLSVTGLEPGLRYAVVDVELEVATRLHLALRSVSAARVRVGTRGVIARPFADGALPSWHTGALSLPAGVHRVVIEVASRGEATRPELGLLLAVEAGAMTTRAPSRLTFRLDGTSTPVAVEPPPTWFGAGRPVATAASLLALGRRREALEVVGAGRSPTLAVLGHRALGGVAFLSPAERDRRRQGWAAQLAGVDRWEPRLVVAEQERRARDGRDGAVAGLTSLGIEGEPAAAAAVTVVAKAAQLAHGAGLPGLRDRLYTRLKRRAPRTFLLGDVDASLFRRVGPEAACGGSRARHGLACFERLLAWGDRIGAEAELRRLRRLRGSESSLREEQLRMLLEFDEPARALLLYDALPPPQRRIAWLSALWRDTPEMRRRLRRDRVVASDTPRGLLALDVRRKKRGLLAPAEVAKLVAADRDQPFAPGAGTAVLERRERYVLRRERGRLLLSFALHDLRRVNEALDVDRGTWLAPPVIDGRVESQVLRRRIFKRSGDIIDPDPTSEGDQFEVELAQLEPGDHVETFRAGWAVDRGTGTLVVDTPDLLPARTEVRHASVVWLRPPDFPFWVHPRLGDGRARRRGPLLETQWELRDAAPPPSGGGTPMLEARVALSFGDDSLRRIARAIGERLRSLKENSRAVREWARVAVGGATDPDTVVERIVDHAGRSLRTGDRGALSDFRAHLDGGGHADNAESWLADGRGSRTWLIHRALGHVGVTSEIAVAEGRAMSADPRFPPRVGRFGHPLVRVERSDGSSRWIDADVEGAPLPPGLVSPELRGKKALFLDGSLRPIDAEKPQPDEIEISLRMDPQGNSRGRFRAALRSRSGQRLAQALEDATPGAARRALLEGVVHAWLPSAEISSVGRGGARPGVAIVIEATVSRFESAVPTSVNQVNVREISGIWPLWSGYPTSVRSTLAQRFLRQGRPRRVNVPTSTLYRVTRTIELPARAKMGSIPPRYAYDEGSLQARRATSVKGSILVDEFFFGLASGAMAPDDPNQLELDMRSIDAAFLRGVGIELP